MSAYHLNLFNTVGAVPDEAGLDLPNLDAARRQAIEGIRSILSAEVLEGTIDLRGRIEIADADGEILLVVPFVEAFDLSLPEPRR